MSTLRFFLCQRTRVFAHLRRVINTLKCEFFTVQDRDVSDPLNPTVKPVLLDVIRIAKLMEEEKKKLTSLNLALVLVHDLLLSRGIQAGDGPIKQAVLRHKTRLGGEFKMIKIKRGARTNDELASLGDERAGTRYFFTVSFVCATEQSPTARIPRYVRVNTSLWSATDAIEAYTSRGFTLSGPFESK